MKSLNNIFRQWLLLGLLVFTTPAVMMAQSTKEEPIKVIYPGDSVAVTVIDIPPHDAMDTLLLSPDREARLKGTSIQDSAKINRDWSRWRPNPKKALWLAVVLPGAGQIYNRKYWKLPIFYGGIAGCIYAMTWNNQMYRDYSRAYVDIMDSDPSTQSYNDFLHLGNAVNEGNKQYYQDLFKKRKDRYRRWRDLSIFATIGIYALSVIDAYVDASLSDFDISDNLSLHVAPAIINDNSMIGSGNPLKSSALGIGCSLTF